MSRALRCYRPLIVGRRGAAAANHPLAAQAGLMALRAGGNAVDAAVTDRARARRGRADDVGARRRTRSTMCSTPEREGRRVQRHRPGAPRRDAGALCRRHPAHRPLIGVGAGDARRLGMMHAEYGHCRGPSFAQRRSAWRATASARRRTYRHFRRRSSCLPARRQAQRRGLPARRRGAAGRDRDRPARAGRTLEEIAAEGADCFYRGALARRLATALPDCGGSSRRPTSPSSRPKSSSRWRSTITASPCSKRRSIRPGSSCCRS